MNVLHQLFRRKRKNSASVAKERLQIIVSQSHKQGARQSPDYLPPLQRELMQVIKKFNINPDHVKVELEREGHCSILELNITLPDTVPKKD